MAEKGFKRKLAAILSADVEGYSRLMDDDEEATVRTLTSYRIAISDLVQQFRGRVVDNPGDNILADFISVVDAVNCAVEIQRGLAERNAELPYHRQMQFRIGVNLGDVIEEDGRIYGDGVNIAARVESLSEAGGICISGRAYDQVENKLGLAYENLGEHQVKNIVRPIQAYRVLSYPEEAAHKVVQAKMAVREKWRKLAIAAAALIVVVIIAAVIWHFYMRRISMEAGSPEKNVLSMSNKPSIAVLPFLNMSDDPEQEYFSDGITEDLITDLSKIPDLLVIARNSTFTYKGKPINVQIVAKELSVKYVIEGSVRRVENKVRINAQLIDASSGFHLWSERYDGELENIFELQDKITGKIVTALKIRLVSKPTGLSKNKETRDIKAYEYFLKGWSHYLRATGNEFKRAIDLFKKAIEIDPEYNRAYAALALIHWEGVSLSPSGYWLYSMAGPVYGINQNRVLAVKYLNKAMKHPTAVAYAVSSQILLSIRQYKYAIAQAEKAVSLDPNSLTAFSALARALIMSGQAAQALAPLEQLLRIDPINPARAFAEFGLAYFCMGKLQAAYEYIEKAKIHNPMIGCDVRAVIYAYKGMKDEASKAVSECQPPSWDKILSRMMAYPFRDKELAQKFADGLNSAGVPGEAAGYYKIYDEYRLYENEIKNLLLNKKIQVFVTSSVWSLELSDDNVCTYTGIQPTEVGRYWFEKDSIWLDLPQRFYGEKCQANVFENPDGSREAGNLFFFVSSFGIFPFSHEEE